MDITRINVPMFIVCEDVKRNADASVTVVSVIDTLRVCVAADSVPDDATFPLSLPHIVAIIRGLQSQVPFKVAIKHKPSSGASYPDRLIERSLPSGGNALTVVITPKPAVEIAIGRHELILLVDDVCVAKTYFEVTVEATGSPRQVSPAEPTSAEESQKLERDVAPYGSPVWREFSSTRRDILHDYNQAKLRNISQPVRTSHGVSGEASVRRWLEDFLPSRFGVTSGFIVPDMISQRPYKNLHYDVIIFDRMQAPILWADTNQDTSTQGRRRAIPARHVLAVMECKSRFTSSSAKQARSKLAELDDTKGLPPSFWSCVFFMELEQADSSGILALKSMIPDTPIFGYHGGYVLSFAEHQEMVGEISIRSATADDMQREVFDRIAFDIDKIEVHNLDGTNIVLAESAPMGAGLSILRWHDGYHAQRIYSSIAISDELVATIAWSRSGFANACLSILSRLDGVDPRHQQYPHGRFGQVYDVPPILYG